MTAPDVRVLVAIRGHLDIGAIERMVVDEPGLRLAGVVVDDAEWVARSSIEADAVVVACAAPSDEALALVQEETATRPHLPVVVMVGGSPNGFVRQVFEVGADDIVVADDIRTAGGQLGFALQKAMTRKETPVASTDRVAGELICVLGPKGGTGKTLTASNLAVALALAGKRVVLVDLDLQFGDLGLVMGLSPERSIFDLATAGGSLDAQKLDAFLTAHSSGARVLLAPTRPDHAAAVTPEFLRELYPVLRTEFDYVVVDTPPGFTPEVIVTIDVSSSVCLIGTLDAPSLKNAKLGAETLDLMGYPTEQVRLVLNRADTSVGVSHADAVSVLGRGPDVLVPSAREVVRSVNAGDPIVASSPRSEAAKAFGALAQMLMQAGEPARPSGRRRTRGRRMLSRA